MEVPDHRQLGKELGIYATDEVVGSGLPLWLPAGAAIRAALERYIVEAERRAGYQHVYSPALAKRELYERSGHWEHYRDDMYPPMRVGSEDFVLRPMNCPHHILMYKAAPRTRREMPLRLAELGTMFRCERSGVIGGLSRVRQMTLNDGHVFCPPELIGEEIASILGLIQRAYADLGLPDPAYRLARRGEGAKYVEDDAMWVRAEATLRDALDASGVPYDEQTGEAAFYGPKIDLQVRDPLGREETLSTVQVDFHLPARFGLEFVNGDKTERPVMIHHGIIATMERMVAHLLEVHAGALPVWLSPVQCVVLPVVDDAVTHARLVRDELFDVGLRVDLDDRESTLGARIRDAQHRKVPYVVVVGRREMADGTATVRLRDGRHLDAMVVPELVHRMADVDRRRALELDL